MKQQHLHISEEDLILHYYGEHDDETPIEHHLGSCAECRDEFARLSDVLALVDIQESPDLGAGFEREVWARLEPQLALGRPSRWSRWFEMSPRWSLAAGVAALVLVAFVAGRFSTVIPAPSDAPGPTENVAERVLVVAVVDHLDRSQMMLVELMNADLDASTDVANEQLRARELVTSNRLYRQTAVHSGDAATREVLDELERVLIQIANIPQDATKDDLDALRAGIAQRGLLFKVRVVHSEMRERERQSSLPRSTS